MLQESGAVSGGAEIVGKTQGGRERTVNNAARLVGRPGYVEVPTESRADVSAYGFWKQGTTSMFDMRIVILGAGSYLRMTP